MIACPGTTLDSDVELQLDFCFRQQRSNYVHARRGYPPVFALHPDHQVARPSAEPALDVTAPDSASSSNPATSILSLNKTIVFDIREKQNYIIAVCLATHATYKQTDQVSSPGLLGYIDASSIRCTIQGHNRALNRSYSTRTGQLYPGQKYLNALVISERARQEDLNVPNIACRKVADICGISIEIPDTVIAYRVPVTSGSCK